MKMSAIISPCGTYRYTLHREIPQIVRHVKPCLFIMLNPSIADATVNDRTIEKCIKFASREACTSLSVVNLFAYRATKPTELYLPKRDIVGPDNDAHLKEQIGIHKSGLIICAWGAEKIAAKRALAVREIMKELTPSLFCLGRAKNGEPLHPLYLRDDTPLQELS